MLKSCYTMFAWLGLLLLAGVLYPGHHAMAASHAHLAIGAGSIPLLCGFVNMRNLFTREAIIRYLQILGPAFPTVCMDTVFTDRPQQPGPLIGSDIVKQSIKAQALGRRGARSMAITGSTGQTEFYEPLPIHPNISITGADLNNLRMFAQEGPNKTALLAAWATGKTDVLRRTVRSTAEAMCASALTGHLVYPVAIEGGGFETFEIDYGAIQAIDAGYKYWDDPAIKVGDILKMFIQIRKTFQRSGVGGSVIYWAGEDAFMMLFNIVSRILTSTKLQMEANVPVALDQNYIMIGTIKVELRSEEYWDVVNRVFVPVVPKGTLKAIATDAGHRMPYASIDDLDGNLQPMPLFIKPVKTDDPSGYTLIAESKPLPVVNSLGLCDVVVIAPAG